MLAAAAALMLGLGAGAAMAEAEAPVGKVTPFTLGNGLQIVVIEDHRVPVVTHMVWYKIGSIDDPQGASGLAHLLEHLMFKSFDAEAKESFAQIMSRLGAVDNATTGPDSTNYFQRVAKERLADVMAVETRRMSGLTLKEDQVLVERQVVREERRSVFESDPVKMLAEQMMATLYENHSYGRPPIGWAHEISQLKLDDALTAYRNFYIPANAVVIIAGDVTPPEVRLLAAQTYGTINVDRQPPPRLVTAEPEPIAARRVEMTDGRVPQPTLFRYYLTPSYRSATGLQAESLDILTAILGDGETSRLHRAVVTGAKAAVGVSAHYFGEGRDSGRLALFAILPGDGDLGAAEREVDRVIADLLKTGITEDELARAKAGIEARTIIESDNQKRLAALYGSALAVGRTVDDLIDAPNRLARVTKADVEAAAAAFLARQRSVTGVVAPPPQEAKP
ncbi:MULTISPECIES: pitrilysin family protein [Rhodomicrobium]|uniref:M16 family metallopeptidase n=1 Tax=Rhodomicrobium TaxID=1068 RepID=UPI00148335ED|nr:MULTISPECIES: pitrilysin family protein [Rhodomicrobium]